MLYRWVPVTISSVQSQSCLILCDPMNRSTPGLPVHHQLLESTQTHVHWVGDAIQPSVVPFSSSPQSFLASRSFQMSQIFTSGGQSIVVSASASVLPMKTQDWFPLGWAGWISLQSQLTLCTPGPRNPTKTETELCVSISCGGMGHSGLPQEWGSWIGFWDRVSLGLEWKLTFSSQH